MLKLVSLFTVLFVSVVYCNQGTQDVEVRLDDLQAQMQELKSEVVELSKIVDNRDLETMVKHNIADQKLDKAIASLLMNKQEDADLYWHEITDLTDPSLKNKYLKKLIENSYLGNSNNFYFVLDFITRNELYTAGYPMLYKELERNDEFHNGQEIFALAHQAKSVCGTKTPFYTMMPQIVKLILSGPVILQSVETKGYVLADEGYKMCSTRRDCFEYADTQVHIYRQELMTVEEIQMNKRAHWHFMAPENNITALSLGFFIKNLDKDLFFVFRQRPGGVFLRNNLTFDSYYARDFHAQFEPSLVHNANPEDEVLLIGVRERFFKKIEYFRTSNFVPRQNTADFSRLPLFQRNTTGYVWEAIPVQGAEDAIDNAIDGNTDEKCNFIM